jgi:hypothetical protein
LHRVARGDVLEHDLQLGEALHGRPEHLVDEGFFPVEHIHRRVGRFAVHQQRQAELLHFLQRVEAARDARHAGVRMRGRARGVELHAVHASGKLGARDLLGRRVLGQVQRHQRLEGGAVGQCAQDPLAVIERLVGGAHRRLQVRHDDRAGEAARAVGEHRSQRRPVAQVQVPVVRAL